MRQPRRDPAFLWDMLDAARSVIRFVGSKTFEEYLSDQFTQAAVERKIEIIGEAARNVTDDFRESHPEIPWSPIIAQRNVLAHGYFGINQESIWKVITHDIPALIEALDPLIPPLPGEPDHE
jgi:uncharacterized protein with HEPN domain